MLKEILSISGKPGLQKLVSNSSNALIVESLIDGKRFPAYSNAKIIALEDISIYTETEDMPLKDVFKRMYDKEEGKQALSHKESNDKIVSYFSILLALSAITLPILSPALPCNIFVIPTLTLPANIHPSPKLITKPIAGIISIFNRKE